jgi:hypothetical protein
MNATADTVRPTSTSTRAIRLVVALLLFLVGAVAAYGAVLAFWIDAVLLDTDTFVSAIEPLVEDDEVRETASDAISANILDALDIRELADALPFAVDPSVAEELATGFESLVRTTVADVVATDSFTRLWVSEMRRWHTGLVGAVRAADGELVAEEAVLRVTLGPYIDLLVEQIEPPLLRLATVTLIPDALRQMRVVVFDARLVAERLELLRAVHAARSWLPWAAVAALLGGLAAAGRVGPGIAGAGLALALGGAISWAMAQAESSRVQTLVQTEFGATAQSAGAVVATLFGPLETWISYFALVGLVVIAIGVLVVRIGASELR